MRYQHVCIESLGYAIPDETITGDDGIERAMSDDAYRNRLLQYVREQLGKHKHSSVIQKTLDSLGARLKSLDSLASKGVHDDVSAAEAETCIVWTYHLPLGCRHRSHCRRQLGIPNHRERRTGQTEHITHSL